MLPYTCETMFTQIGRGLRGGLCYVGAKNYGYTFPKDGDVSGECRPSKPSEYNTENGTLKQEVGVQFDANVKRSQTWKFIVAYEPDDTYSVYLVKVNGANKAYKTGKISELIAEFHGVYCDNLQSVIESAYDEAIRKFNQGFINV